MTDEEITKAYQIKEIKQKIKQLEKQITIYKEELKNTCPHKNISPGFDKYIYKDDYLFICDDCGMHFITDDPDFKV